MKCLISRRTYLEPLGDANAEKKLPSVLHHRILFPLLTLLAAMVRKPGDPHTPLQGIAPVNKRCNVLLPIQLAINHTMLHPREERANQIEIAELLSSIVN
jgi:hypothetical protein